MEYNLDFFLVSSAGAYCIMANVFNFIENWPFNRNFVQKSCYRFCEFFVIVLEKVGLFDAIQQHETKAYNFPWNSNKAFKYLYRSNWWRFDNNFISTNNKNLAHYIETMRLFLYVAQQKIDFSNWIFFQASNRNNDKTVGLIQLSVILFFISISGNVFCCFFFTVAATYMFFHFWFMFFFFLSLKPHMP